MCATFRLSLAAFAFASLAFGQNHQRRIGDATSLSQSKDYQKSVVAFEEAFKLEANRANDFYNGACSAALAGRPELALDWLQKAANLGWANPQHLQADADLTSLHDLPRWALIVAAMKQRRRALDANIDRPLRAELRVVLAEDQKYRLQIEGLEKPVAATRRSCVNSGKPSGRKTRITSRR